MAVIPTVRGLILCDFHVGYDNQKVDLYGICNAIRPREVYPYDDARFCVYSQLSNGLGVVDFFLDIRSAATNELVHATITRQVYFDHRFQIVELAMLVKGVRFDEPGIYLVQLFCNNSWVCDTPLRLLDATEEIV